MVSILASCQFSLVQRLKPSHVWDGQWLRLSFSGHPSAILTSRTNFCFFISRNTEDNVSKRRRVCRSGCGVEMTPGKCDTPGFKDVPFAAIICEQHGGYKRLELPRKRPKHRLNILPTSMALVFGWRANCDVRVLLYESDPQNPDANDIVKVTNYIVAYASKGAETVESEKQQLRSIVLAAQETTGCSRDVITLARHILNRYLGEKMISKQECMVLLAGLDLYHCSESFERISLSGYVKLTKKGTSGANKHLIAYANRDVEEQKSRRLSFNDWYMKNHAIRRGKIYIPHYPGRGTQPVYPLTEHNSKMLLIMHKPWSKTAPLGNTNYCRQLRHFLQSSDCPIPLRMMYERDTHNAKHRLTEPTQSINTMDEEKMHEDADPDLQDAIKFFSSLPSSSSPAKTYNYNYDFGVGYAWSRSHIDISYNIDDACTWLQNEISKTEEQTERKIQLPINPNRQDGRYLIEDLLEGQQLIALEVVKTLAKWVDCISSPEEFKPLRLTIRGKAGTGKTTLIHTLVSITKTLFNCDEAVAVVCPSGCAASNAGGKTIHNRFRIAVKGKDLIPGSLKRNLLRKENARLTVLIVDERSMVSADALGIMASYIEQTAHNGMNSSHTYGWGGVPVVLFFGDDGQLPSVKLGAFDFQECQRTLSLAEAKGLSIFRTMGQHVRTLQTNIRQSDASEFQKILDEVYTGYTSLYSCQKLMELHLDNERFSPDAREIIKARSIYVFANKEPMEHHNERCLYRDSGEHNPVARLRSVDSSLKNGKGKLQHAVTLPRSTILARKSKVAITGRNIRPEWGLYNNAVGTIVDILFSNGESPNDNNLPSFILVDFPGYTGPPFIETYPTIIPVAPVEVCCEHKCCRRKQMPLRLAYGQTIHTFQGATVGPSTSKRRYIAQSIIVDPGTLSFEGKCPGLFYSGVSRPTTNGIFEDVFSSALYFEGKNMSNNRMKDMVHGKDGRVFSRITKRDIWTAYLNRNDRIIEMTTTEKQSLKKWANTTRLESDILDRIIDAHCHKGIRNLIM